jgi:hypothetical protein
MRRTLLALVLCACGARSEIAGSGDDLFDSSVPISDGSFGFDATKDGSTIADGGAGADVVTCTAATNQIACGSPPCLNCKFEIEWTCGNTKYRIGGYCDPTSLFPDAGFLEGVCAQDGKQTSTFKEPATTCDCADASALLTVVQEKCQHQ